MDCYFHSNVPSVAPCADCAKPICATCRDDRGACPSCRLAAKIDSASASRQHLGGQVPPRSNAQPPPFYQGPWAQQGYAAAPTVTSAAVATLDPVESRALVALGYPLWPLALISLFDRKQSPALKRQAYQAIGFNLGIAALWGVLWFMGNIPFPTLAGSSDVMEALLIPFFLVASVFYGIKVWQGDDVRVPILADWIDERLPEKAR
ncbi:MAG TPA: hypothetical protein VMS32_07850 [Verrucomicrobiae bacterium]|nr:hypothetical protein [Verrucomicrobiae bacterium]